MKKKVALLFGGMSTEHDISCVSVCGILENIDRRKFETVPIGITKGGAWIVYKGSVEDIKTLKWEEKTVGKTASECKKEFNEAMSEILDSDIVFPMLHGKFGEDGTAQGMFEMLGKPYVGCRVLASSLAMDKVYAKKIFDQSGIPQCKYVWINREDYEEDKDKFIKKAIDALGFPCFVKPANCGSSVGVGKANDEKELRNALDTAASYDRRLLVEEYVDAREIECAVLGNQRPIAATPGEIVPSKEFYDFEDKYKTGTSYCVIPAKIQADKLETIRKLAIDAYKALDCSGLSRVDFFLCKDGRIFLNEINTIPGFTQISMYPKLFEAEGIPYKELITKIIEAGLDYDKEIKELK